MSNGLVRFAAASAAVIVLLIFGLNGTAQAPSSAPVRVVDGSNPNQSATVDPDGNLHVAGQVTVDSSTPVATTSTVDPYQVWRTSSLFAGQRSSEVDFDVPAGKLLIVEFVSLSVTLELGQDVRVVRLVVDTPPGPNDLFWSAHFDLEPIPGVGGGIEEFAAQKPMKFYAPSGTGVVRLIVSRDSDLGDGRIEAALTGFLVDA